MLVRGMSPGSFKITNARAALRHSEDAIKTAREFSRGVVPPRVANWLQLICPQQHLEKIKLGCVSLFAPAHLLHKQSDSAKWDDPSWTHEPPHPSSSNVRNLVTGHASGARKEGFYLRVTLPVKGKHNKIWLFCLKSSIFWLPSFQHLRTKRSGIRFTLVSPNDSLKKAPISF